MAPPTTLGAPDQLDFDESDFFNDDATAPEPIVSPPQHCAVQRSDQSDSDSLSDDGLAISDCSSSDNEDAVEESLRLRLQSLQSSLTQPTPMEDLGTTPGSRVGSLKTFGDGPLARNSASENDLMAASLPAAAAIHFQGYKARRASHADAICKLGTSMPIGIPLMQRRMLAGNSFEAGEEGFVPPHLVEQEGPGDMRELFRSVSGLSPSAAVRRERLAQRNYIMRATGFLETAPLGAPIGETTDRLKESLMGEGGLAIPARPPQRVPTQTSSLSAALGLGTTPQ
ncbi:hypothetical protein N2152v2_010467 [Parachlorella kessleri]